MLDTFIPATRTGVAKRVNEATARHWFNAGGRVAVSVDGEQSFDVYPLTTTTHHRDRGTFQDLVDTVKSYGDPRQAYYVIHPDPTTPTTPAGGNA